MEGPRYTSIEDILHRPAALASVNMKALLEAARIIIAN
jgi:hypothetical protein